MKNIFVIKGISATGKSTRVMQLILFFEQVMGYEREPFFYFNEEKQKNKEVGVYFKKPNILFLGKPYEMYGIERFQGYDAVTSSFGNSSLFSEFLKENGKKHNIVVEGASITLTNRLRPDFLFNFCGYKNQFFQYYNYEDSPEGKKKYHERLMLRSGKVTEKDSMWVKCKSYEGEFQKVLNEKEDLGDKCFVYSQYNDETPPVSDLGVKILLFLNYDDDIIEAFIDFCNLIDYTSKNVYKCAE